MSRTLTALGLMSGTSMDGIDAAIVRTDGETVLSCGPALQEPYDSVFRDQLRTAAIKAAKGEDYDEAHIVRALTERHAHVVKRLFDEQGVAESNVDVIGFHGHTLWHRAERGETLQIGDGALLAKMTNIPVVCDFRSEDMAQGGEGAPLVPLFHAALAGDLEKPLVVLNLGGVANLTYLGASGQIMAFDTGPGNALIDDWMRIKAGLPMDEGGRLARSGKVDAGALDVLLGHEFFRKNPPKSLDRNDFSFDALSRLSPQDGAATLSAFTARAVSAAQAFFPAPSARWLVCGGGRHNDALMEELAGVLEAPVAAVESVGWDGDALEAQAFGFLGVRSLYGKPLTLPQTTGVRRPASGGARYDP
jgi:anhydro-N-acetylmuramic acid kinase